MAFFFICIGAMALFFSQRGSSLERALSAKLSGESTGEVDLSIRSVQCNAPHKNQPRSCTVAFSDDYKLPSVEVKIPANAQGFQAAFTFSQEGAMRPVSGMEYRARVITSYDGDTQSLVEIMDALVETFFTAEWMAVQAVGEPYFIQREKLNHLDSYK
jgi:hypothetical protein